MEHFASGACNMQHRHTVYIKTSTVLQTDRSTLHIQSKPEVLDKPNVFFRKSEINTRDCYENR